MDTTPSFVDRDGAGGGEVVADLAGGGVSHPDGVRLAELSATVRVFISWRRTAAPRIPPPAGRICLAAFFMSRERASVVVSALSPGPISMIGPSVAATSRVIVAMVDGSVRKFWPCS